MNFGSTVRLFEAAAASEMLFASAVTSPLTVSLSRPRLLRSALMASTISPLRFSRSSWVPGSGVGVGVGSGQRQDRLGR